MAIVYLQVILIGIFSAATGVILRWMQPKNLLPSHAMVLLGIAGMLGFGILGSSEWQQLHWQAVAIGLIGGATQYIPVRLFKRALDLGPLSPAWCVLCLGEFVPVIIFAALFMKELPTKCQYFSLLATFAAIFFASLGENNGPKRTMGWRSKLVYVFYLVTIFISISLLSIGLKYSTGEELQQQQNIIMFFVYMAMCVLSAIELTLTRKWTFNRDFWICGSAFSGCSIMQYLLIVSLVSQPATLVFALNCSVSILTAALFSTFVFREKRTPVWYAMLAASLLAILLNR